MNQQLEQAKSVIAQEIAALKMMSERLNDQFSHAVELIMNTTGRLVVIGMGKSGLIGQKIVATMASTGTPAFSVHPGEAFHGDLGMIKPDDVALLISNSGETDEVIRILPFLKFQGNRIIAMTGKLNSTLAQHAHAVLDVSVEKEACPNNLAPTSSTTNTLVMGDALAVVLSINKNFQPEDFARFHPGGSLGRKLLTKVGDVMHKDNLPFCTPTSSFRDVLQTITAGRLGVALVLHEQKLVGIITDGDVRRAYDKSDDVKQLSAQQMMTTSPVTIDVNERFADAEALMQRTKIYSLVVTDKESVVGVLQIYDMK
ncbi:MAG: KpsF/GutQ family sugar-phosphate isomerase [Gammaproteobacteria bacterium]|nr:KpsF/GutQ family sugar-phosphate isomerase [Gammaproteobacteria bacterium]